MIVAIEGKIEKKEATTLHINVGGIVYEVFVSINCSSLIKKEKIKLFTTFIVKEDSQKLYGFVDINEKQLFDTIIKINGIGPKVALAICSTFTPSSFANIINTNDITMLKKVPGIGAKVASRILVELNNFVLSKDPSNNNTSNDEAKKALESLGFKKEIINKTLYECHATDTASLIKEALKKLQK